jgi:hypothetical protein
MTKLCFIGYPRLRISGGDDATILDHLWHRDAGPALLLSIIDESSTSFPLLETCKADVAMWQNTDNQIAYNNAETALIQDGIANRTSTSLCPQMN